MKRQKQKGESMSVQPRELVCPDGTVITMLVKTEHVAKFDDLFVQLFGARLTVKTGKEVTQ